MSERPSFVLPDLHGRSAQLDKLLLLLPADANFIFLGDLIDRGPNSLGVFRIVLQLIERGQAACLLGNHEDQLLEILTTNRLGLNLSTDRQRLVNFFGKDRLVEILQAFPMTFQFEDLFCTHAPVLRYPPITEHSNWQYSELHSFDQAVEAGYDFTGSSLHGLLSGDDVVDDPLRISVCGHMEFEEVIWYPSKMLCLDTRVRRNRFYFFDVNKRTVYVYDGTIITPALSVPRKVQCKQRGF